MRKQTDALSPAAADKSSSLLPRIFGQSIFFKMAFLLFLSICTACALTFFLMFGLMNGKIIQSAEQALHQRANFILMLKSRSDLTSAEITELDFGPLGAVRWHRLTEPLPFSLEGISSPADLREGVLYISQKALPLPAGILRQGDEYFALYNTPYNSQTSIIHELLFRTLLLCAGVASLCCICLMWRATNPLRKLNDAIIRVGQGDFSVHVPYRHRDELGKFVNHFNWMVEQLRGIETLRRDFVNSVSHELKTPISAVQGSARMLASLPPEKLTPERLHKYTALIIDATARMSSLSSNLLRLSRLESGTTQPVLTEFSLDEQLRRCILLLENQWIAKHQELDVQLDTLNYTGDAELLTQVWLNLLSNAVKFTPENGQIQVRLSSPVSPLKTCVVEISDTGSGMTPEVRARMFEPFFQGDASHKREGNGLGLSIVRRILDLHHAEITCESLPTKGTRFIIVLHAPSPVSPAAD